MKRLIHRPTILFYDCIIVSVMNFFQFLQHLSESVRIGDREVSFLRRIGLEIVQLVPVIKVGN